eukprot:scaffold1521_cov271-Chaetoceros_neogracile.AAC.63
MRLYGAFTCGTNIYLNAHTDQAFIFSTAGEDMQAEVYEIAIEAVEVRDAALKYWKQQLEAAIEAQLGYQRRYYDGNDYGQVVGSDDDS